MATTTTTEADLMGIPGALEAIFDFLDPAFTVYHIQAPQKATLPYIVLSVITGTPDYAFDGEALENVTIQISQFYGWEGLVFPGLDDFEVIVGLIDLEALTTDGIILNRLTNPRVLVEDGRVLHISSDWNFQYYRE